MLHSWSLISFDSYEKLEMGEKQQHFVFVHGAGHGAWCWFKTIQLLEQARHRATAVDLAGAGASTVDEDSIESLDQYSQPLYDLLESLYTDQKVVLVGHSMGGSTVARATERYPHKIHVAVYLAANMFASGISISDPSIDEVYSDVQKASQFFFGRGVHNPPTSCIPTVEFMKKNFYSCCSSEDIQLALKHVRRIPIVEDATLFTEKGYYSVPRVYIRTSFDKTILPHFQDLFISQNPPTAVIELESDHSPFFSAARELHQHLLDIAATYAS